MNRFQNRPQSDQDYFCDTFSWGRDIRGEYQDLYDMLADDYRCGYHGERKLKLLLYIQHRAYREYGVILSTGQSRLDAYDTHHGDPADIALLCEQYDSYEREEVQEFLAGIR